MHGETRQNPRKGGGSGQQQPIESMIRLVATLIVRLRVFSLLPTFSCFLFLSAASPAFVEKIKKALFLHELGDS